MEDIFCLVGRSCFRRATARLAKGDISRESRQPAFRSRSHNAPPFGVAAGPPSGVRAASLQRLWLC